MAADVKEKKPNLFKRLGKYCGEVKGELKKVVWPTGKELMNYVLTVLVFIAAIAIVLGILDFAFGEGFKALADISLTGNASDESALRGISMLGSM